jgi:hypothetical protein
VAEAEASVPKKLFKSMSLRFVLSQAEGYPGAVSDFALAAALPAFERAGVDLSECGAPGVSRYTGRGPLGVDQSPPPCVEICCCTSRFGIDSCSVSTPRPLGRDTLKPP